jgi:hypothetical protein
MGRLKKLSANVSDKVKNGLVDVRLASEGECPAEVGVVVQNHEVVIKA